MLKRLIRLGVFFIIGSGALVWWELPSLGHSLDRLGDYSLYHLSAGRNDTTSCCLTISRIQSGHDQDGDGISDAADILAGARRDVANRPKYVNAYYRGGYPPDNEGVCTDVIWRAFREAGYDLKAMVDKDIRENRSRYPRVDRPDPNIDFRRVLNLNSFFRHRARSLTLQVIPGKKINLQEWQGGDIVIFGSPCNHIAVVSDRRRNDGVPYLIHNRSPYTMEEDALLYWAQKISPIVGHYRWVQ
jgi:uncharacterized protein YijF (DUF1287 family)